MNVAIVVFSPSGNTLKVAKMLERSLETRDISVQIVNMSANESLSQPHRVQHFYKNL